MKKNKAIAVLALCGMIAACTSSTMINSEPKGASVYVDGQKLGKTPYLVSDSKTFFTKTTLTLKKDGYEDVNAFITKDGSINIGACIGGVFFLIPFLWIKDYQPVYNFELDVDASAAGAPGAW